MQTIADPCPASHRVIISCSSSQAPRNCAATGGSLGQKDAKGVDMTIPAAEVQIVAKATQVVKLGEDTRAKASPSSPSQVISGSESAPVKTAQVANEFICIVNKEGQKLGVRVEYVRDKCIVIALTEGLIPSWNLWLARHGYSVHICTASAMCAAAQAIRIGDRIAQVNGETARGIEVADKLARSTGQVEILVERPHEIRIPIQAGTSLGIKVAELLEGFGLEENELLRVKESDRIVEVNGKQASSTELFELISSSNCQEILVYSYS
eukprot:Skav226523  [mRNA]  locus=scaffold1773:211132:218847:- [translate_table: standard]